MVRASDAVLVRGNTARILTDGPSTFDAWLDAISAAREWIHLENYIIRNDRMGRIFRELLADRARDGIRVRILHDWLGCWATPNNFWKPLRAAGVEVRAFAPPRLSEPLRLLRRDHRKVVVTDGTYASVAGMCIGDEWAGDAEAGIPAWRDTGVEVTGPAAAVIDRAFARAWREAGDLLPLEEIPDPHNTPRTGEVSIRIVEGEPGRSRIYRLSQFVTVGVEHRLWITDPYFVTPPAMTEALAAAARDGVDVRILVPAYNNWPVIGGFSRAGYRPLLEAGVRLFEWEGPMIHAKTAVADSVWSRVGSSNLNLASLLSNWELDLAILDRSVASVMEDLFLQDLSSSVEIKLPPPTGIGGRRSLLRTPIPDAGPEPEVEVAAAREARRRARRGSRVGRIVSRVARASIVLGRALIGQRPVGNEDAAWIMAIAIAVIAASIVGFAMPTLLAWPLAFALFWVGVASFYRAVHRGTND
ncbi:MAG: cardiolipin synthase B [Gemmatimonas sp.]|nr:cardiolipin synthase B [Gemmatimonas sp.]